MEQKEVKQVKQEIEWSAGFFPPNAGGDISIEEVCQRLGEQLLNTCEVLWQIQNTIDTVEKEIDTLQDQLTPLKKQYTQFLELATRYHYLPPGDKLQANEKGIGTQAWYEMFDSISAQMIPLEENISSLRISGYIEGNGIVKVYLGNYLVLNSFLFHLLSHLPIRLLNSFF